jgi:hypothetical protein
VLRQTYRYHYRNFGAPGRTRTSTMLPPPDFESGFKDFLIIPLVSWACKGPLITDIFCEMEISCGST